MYNLCGCVLEWQTVHYVEDTQQMERLSGQCFITVITTKLVDVRMGVNSLW